MTIEIYIQNEIIIDQNKYHLYIYKNLDFISNEQLNNIDPRNNDNFIEIPLITPPLNYEYESNGVTKFMLMVLYKVFDETDTIQLGAIFRSDDYYDSSLFTKMTIDILLSGIIANQFTINQIKIQMLDHNNEPFNVAHTDYVSNTLTSLDPNKIHYNKDLSRLIKSTRFIDPQNDLTVLGSNVILNNSYTRRIAYVNPLQSGYVPIIYNEDFIGQIIESSVKLTENVLSINNLLECPFDSPFVSSTEYPELYDLIGDSYLYTYELYAKIIENNIVSEIKYSELTLEQIPLVVEEYYVSTPAEPIEDMFKLPSKAVLGSDNDNIYYIKFATSLSTLQSLLLDNINGVTIDPITHSITLTTTNIPQGENLYYLDSYLDPIRDEISIINDEITSTIKSINTDILPDEVGNAVLTAESINTYTKEDIDFKISELNGLITQLQSAISNIESKYIYYDSLTQKLTTDAT